MERTFVSHSPIQEPSWVGGYTKARKQSGITGIEKGQQHHLTSKIDLQSLFRLPRIIFLRFALRYFKAFQNKPLKPPELGSIIDIDPGVILA